MVNKMENKKDSGILKVRSIIGIVTGVLSITGTLSAALYFVITIKAGLTQIKNDFIEYTRKDATQMANYVPKTEIEIQFRNMNLTLGDIKEQLRKYNEENNEFREKFYNLIIQLERESK